MSKLSWQIEDAYKQDREWFELYRFRYDKEGKKKALIQSILWHEYAESLNDARFEIAEHIKEELEDVENEHEKNEIRGRAAIYRACCRVLKVSGKNQFAAAKQYAHNAEIIHEGYYEIRGLDTKSGNPEIVKWSVK